MLVALDPKSRPCSADFVDELGNALESTDVRTKRSPR